MTCIKYTSIIIHVIINILIHSSYWILNFTLPASILKYVTFAHTMYTDVLDCFILQPTITTLVLIFENKFCSKSGTLYVKNNFWEGPV